MNNQQSYYQQLAKPPFAPPANIFGIVWPVLYMLILISFGYTVFAALRGQLPKTLLLPVAINVVSNGLYTLLFFSWRQPLLATIDTFVVVASLVWFMALMWSHARWPVAILLPYLAWTAFAAVLQTSIWWLNR